MVKCLAQGHKRRDWDLNPHSDNARTWVQCTRPLGHDTHNTFAHIFCREHCPIWLSGVCVWTDLSCMCTPTRTMLTWCRTGLSTRRGKICTASELWCAQSRYSVTNSRFPLWVVAGLSSSGKLGGLEVKTSALVSRRSWVRIPPESSVEFFSQSLGKYRVCSASYIRWCKCKKQINC